MPIRRRTLLATLPAAGLLRTRTWAATPPSVRVGTLRFGSVAWELDVIRAHGLDTQAGVTIQPVEYAAAQASQVALQAGSVDMVLQDWLWVSRQRASGADWTFSPNTSAVGAVMAPDASPVQNLADLTGRRLGIAGGPLDKSWLLLRAYANRALGIDLDKGALKSFGAPPLLAEQLRTGRLDAVLTYWPFAARAEALGMRRVISVEDAVAGLGVSPHTPVLGWVFSAAWAKRADNGAQAFLAASRAARDILARSDAEWDRIAPLTGAASAAELMQLRDWYRSGIPGDISRGGEDDAARLFEILAKIGGVALVGDSQHLAPGTFWQTGDGRPG